MACWLTQGQVYGSRPPRDAVLVLDSDAVSNQTSNARGRAGEQLAQPGLYGRLRRADARARASTAAPGKCELPARENAACATGVGQHIAGQDGTRNY
jgi:hypothetical protein